jgi:hypothetical protein
MKRLLAVALATALVTPSIAEAGRGGHVHSYTRRDGTYVSGHYRRGSSGGSSSYSYSTQSHTSYSTRSHSTRYTSSYTPGYVQRNGHGKIKRSASAKAAFRRSSPCPSTGKTTGRCPGYEVDHRTPLACGGADAPSNMQWLTTSENRHKGAAGCARR